MWYCNIKVVEKAIFCSSDVMLSCCVLTPCNDDLSLFSVTCSIFIYDRASFIPTVFLWLYHPFFCAIPATNEKNKEKEYFMRPVIHSPLFSFGSLIVVWHKPSCFCSRLRFDAFVPTSLHRDSRVVLSWLPLHLKSATKAFVMWKLFF